jgi:hypothetical protein
MAPFFWLHYLFAALQAVTSYATPTGTIEQPEDFIKLHKSLEDIMYAGSNTLIVNSS